MGLQPQASVAVSTEKTEILAIIAPSSVNTVNLQPCFSFKLAETRVDMAPKTAQELGATQLSGLRWAEGLIADKAARREFASFEFRADDADKSGALDREEVVVCITRICKKFGLALPREEKIVELLNLCDKVCCFHGCRGAHHVVLFLRQRFPPTGRTMTARFRSRSFVRQRQLKLWTPKPSRSCMPLRALLSSPLPPPTLLSRLALHL